MMIESRTTEPVAQGADSLSSSTQSLCSRFVLALLILATTAQAAIWPEQWWEYNRQSIQPVAVTDKTVWDEYGLDLAETAQYDDGKVHFKATGYRLRDSTSALAAFQWLRPGDWRASEVTDLAATNGRDTLFTQGNYLILLEGHLPDAEKMDILYVQLSRMERSSLPPLATYLPAQGLVAGSQRYVIGPASLEKFEPRIPPSIAAFHLGAEAQLGRYADGTSLAVFNYPTPAMAKTAIERFRQVPGALAKRSGPMVAVVFSPNADGAERLLARINYKAFVSWDENPNAPPQENAGDLILGIFRLIGALILAIGAGGLLIGLVKFLGRRYLGWHDHGDPMLQLHIDDDHRP
jgi:hypothetical protein